jgi:hypothetical protein
MQRIGYNVITFIVSIIFPVILFSYHRCWGTCGNHPYYTSFFKERKQTEKSDKKHIKVYSQAFQAANAF